VTGIQPNRNGSEIRRGDVELADTLIAISIVVKKFVARIMASDQERRRQP
jgi:hypothetical protein